jgi:hypothetical protein
MNTHCVSCEVRTKCLCIIFSVVCFNVLIILASIHLLSFNEEKARQIDETGRLDRATN